jgi:outer membrane receptor protein involved in Fe transport
VLFHAGSRRFRTVLALLVAQAVVASVAATPAAAAEEQPELTLTELLNMNTSAGTITGTTTLTAPVAVTTIRAEEIELAPARNLYDLLEIYVPGAFVVNHNEDFHPGVRGIVSDRNYKFLLLVNGRNMNQQGHLGATAELENWDLGDIAQIDVIRGPGSVTYGPGAIMGVISITTKDALTGGTQAAVKYIDPYRSAGMSTSVASKSGPTEVYAYASVFSTRGIVPAWYAGDKNSNVGYVGRSFPADSPYYLRSQTYMRDYLDHPQVKLHFDLRMPRGWDFWGRYTSSGMPTPRSGAGAASQQVDASGIMQDFKGFNDRRLTVAGENQHDFNAAITLKSMLSWSLEDYDQFESLVDPIETSSLKNNKVKFSETALFARTLGVLRHNDHMSSALGLEYSHQSFGPGFGSTPDAGFKMGDGSEIVSGPSSHTVGPSGELLGGNGVTKPIFAGSGWSTDTFSAMAETNLEFDKLFGVIASGRVDKNTFSKVLLSPRLVVLSRFGHANVLKAIVQQSKRMNTAEQLYIQHRAGSTADPETLTGGEVALTTEPLDPLFFTVSGFYNVIDVIGWNGTDATVPVGQLTMYGGEADLRYSTPGINLGFNHSMARQLSWKLAPGQTASGVSYSDYNRTVDATNNVVLHEVGNNLNNVPGGITKLYATYSFYRFTAHADAHVFWGWPGMSDGLTSLQRATVGTPREAATNAAIAAARNRQIYDTDVRVNASLKVDLGQHLSLTAYIINLIGNAGNKRYAYDAGINSASPNRIGWVEEPRAFGLQVRGTL